MTKSNETLMEETRETNGRLKVTSLDKDKVDIYGWLFVSYLFRNFL